MKSDNLKRILAAAALAVGLWLILVYFAQPSRPAGSGGPAAGRFALAPGERPGPLPAAEELGVVLPRQPDAVRESASAVPAVRYQAPTPEQQEEARQIEQLEKEGIVVY